MPSGRVHTAINLTILAVATTAALSLDARLSREDTIPFISAYLIGTFLITPDLDLADQRVQARNNWGLLGLLWVPFGVMSRHRGLNHTYVIGPVLRLAYLAVVIAAIWAVLTSLWPDAAAWKPELPATSTLIIAAAGYWTSQALHLMADGIRPFSTREHS